MYVPTLILFLCIIIIDRSNCFTASFTKKSTKSGRQLCKYKNTGIKYNRDPRNIIETKCFTPYYTLGVCRPIEECQSMYQLYTKPTKTVCEKALITLSRCHIRTPFVSTCCEIHHCITPDQAPGICRDIRHCPTMRPVLEYEKLLPNDTKSFVKASICKGDGDYGVCCSKKMPPIIKKLVKKVNVDALLPSKDICGRLINSNKITNGRATDIDQYPWLALLEYRPHKKVVNHVCGATLISKRYVLTAAHCVSKLTLKFYGEPVSVILGEFDTSHPGSDCVSIGRGEIDCTDDPITVPIERIIIHDDYDSTSKVSRNDIALIRLKYDIDFTDFIQPICLPEAKDIKRDNNTEYIIAGWGATETGNSSNVKMHASIPHVDKCTQHYGKRLLWEGQICAGGKNGTDSCVGDSGGPLMRETETYILDGVVSYGKKPCGTKPAIYTKVQKYLNWIKDNIRP